MKFFIVLLILNLFWIAVSLGMFFLGDLIKKVMVRDYQSLTKRWMFIPKDEPDVTADAIGLPPLVAIVMTGVGLLMLDIMAISFWYGAQ